MYKSLNDLVDSMTSFKRGNLDKGYLRSLCIGVPLIFATHLVEGSQPILDLIRTQEGLVCESSFIPNLADTYLASWHLEKKERSIKFSSPKDEAELLVNYKPSRTNWRVAIITVSDDQGRKYLQLRLSPNCQISRIRKLVFDEKGNVDSIQNLEASTFAVSSTEPQNPEFPKKIIHEDTQIDDRSIIALVDTGVNYLLQELYPFIATDLDGNITGYDFWDDDQRPFDKDPRSNPFFPLHHGTTVFSVLIRELKGQKVAVYRFPAGNLCKFEQLLAHVETHNIRVVAIPMGSKNRTEWLCFEKKARNMPQTIFIVSAGNNGIDIDKQAIYPASFDLDNMIVVSSGNKFGLLGPQSNYGRDSVDLVVPAERISVIDHRGVKTYASGSSYAVPRVAALVGRYIKSNPRATSVEVKRFLQDRAIPSSKIKLGWIPDPTDDFGF